MPIRSNLSPPEPPGEPSASSLDRWTRTGAGFSLVSSSSRTDHRVGSDRPGLLQFSLRSRAVRMIRCGTARYPALIASESLSNCASVSEGRWLSRGPRWIDMAFAFVASFALIADSLILRESDDHLPPPESGLRAEGKLDLNSAGGRSRSPVSSRRSPDRCSRRRPRQGFRPGARQGTRQVRSATRSVAPSDPAVGDGHIRADLPQAEGLVARPGGRRENSSVQRFLGRGIVMVPETNRSGGKLSAEARSARSRSPLA